MVKVLMVGCNGRMGKVISAIVEKEENMEIVAGVDIVNDPMTAYPVFASVGEVIIPVDVVIDFSSAKNTDALLAYLSLIHI